MFQVLLVKSGTTYYKVIVNNKYIIIIIIIIKYCSNLVNYPEPGKIESIECFIHLSTLNVKAAHTS